MKILGIGNGIVDVICKVENKFITQNNLTKSTMKLVGEAEFKKLLSTLKIEDTVSGGSVANSIVGLSQLGNNVGFFGKISDDGNAWVDKHSGQVIVVDNFVLEDTYTSGGFKDVNLTVSPVL